MEETEISIEEVEVWVVPEEDVIAFLEEENKDNVNREQEEEESE